MKVVYLAGEIHSPWRDKIIKLTEEKGLKIKFLFPELSHDKSDNIAIKILNDQGSQFYNDNASAKINSIKIHNNILKSDLVIIKFGENYKQWNSAFDAGFAYANNKKIITIYPMQFSHALKEINSISSACVQNEEQVVQILEYLSK
jgi:YtoQ family protein